MKVAITGAAGFIGRNCLDHFKDTTSFDIVKSRTHTIDNVQDLSFESHWNINFSNVDAVIHLASETSVRSSLPGREILRKNLDLSETVYRACVINKVRLLINVSSSSLYGNVLAPQSEQDIPEPLSAYGMSKLAVEHALQVNNFGNKRLTVVNLRLFNALGKYQRHNMLPYQLLHNQRKGLTTELYGCRYRAWTPVNHIVKCLDTLIHSDKLQPGKTYTFNYGSPVTLSQRDLIDIFEDNLCQAIHTRLVTDDRPTEMWTTLPNTERIEKELKVSPPDLADIRIAVNDVVNWYCASAHF